MEDRQNYFVSVVEREVQAGLLGVADTKTACVALVREIRNVNMHEATANGGKEGKKSMHYFDTKENGEVDKDAAKMITELRLE